MIGNRLVRERMEQEESLAMLSTLGGAYSCLGEKDWESAATAGRIAERQLSLSATAGDPCLIARSCLFRVFSYCQRGMRRPAVRMMRLVHRMLTRLMRENRCDPVLVNMYQAAVHKITHMDHWHNRRSIA